MAAIKAGLSIRPRGALQQCTPEKHPTSRDRSGSSHPATRNPASLVQPATLPSLSSCAECLQLELRIGDRQSSAPGQPGAAAPNPQRRTAAAACAALRPQARPMCLFWTLTA